MTTLKVEQLGEELVIRLGRAAGLGLRAGDEVHLARSIDGEISLMPTDMDHQLRVDRGRAQLRRLRGAVGR